MKNLLRIILLLAACNACVSHAVEVSNEQLFEVEKQFSSMSENFGMRAAFRHYCDEEAVLLRANSYPIVGKDSLASYLSGINDSLFTLTWEAKHALLARSGDLGYTYGIYKMVQHDDSQSTSYGSYVTIWKKNEEGEWKYVLDTGQDGLE